MIPLSNKLLTFLTPIFEKKEKNRTHLLKIIPKDSICAEIGVWKGDFSSQILKVVNPKKLHLIAPWKFIPAYSDRWYGGAIAKGQVDMDEIYNKVRRNFKKSKKVVVHREFSDKVVKKFKDNYFDFVYIDGDHSYEFVKKDLEGFLPKIKKGGYLTVDDYAFWKIVLGYGVKKAVDEFVRNHKKIDLRVDGGQAILRVK